MKTYFILFVSIMLTGIACKKNNQRDTLPKEKKWVVTTVAGDGRPAFANGPVLTASFRAPLDVVVTAEGVVYVADAINHRIRKIADGQVTTFAGRGTGDTTSGNGSVAGFVLPSELAIDNNDNVYTLDLDDPRIRKISSAAFVSVYAGEGVEGYADGGAPTAQFGEEAAGITTDEQENIYVSDYENRRIRKISTTGQVTTIAGNGKTGFVNGKADSAQFFSLGGIVIDKQGNLFVADGSRVRKITPSGEVSTFVGSDSSGYRDGQTDAALFTLITDMAIDDRGNIYLSDDNRIRKITPQGLVSTFAGSTAGYEDGDASSAKFYNPAGLGIDKQGNIYVADANNNRIRKISFE
ncbi:MAG: NHL repeat-containing protein [Chitinophagales bacterium]